MDGRRKRGGKEEEGVGVGIGDISENLFQDFMPK